MGDSGSSFDRALYFWMPLATKENEQEYDSDRMRETTETFIWSRVPNRRMARRIDCGFFLIIPPTDLEGRREILRLHEETMERVKLIQNHNEQENERRFLRYRDEFNHQIALSERSPLDASHRLPPPE